MKYIKVAAALFVALFAYVYVTNFISGEFKKANAPALDCVANFFDKQARVFDAITICGTSGVPATKLRHAAAVAAKWLDNDEDGVADEPRLIEALKANNPILVMSAAGFSTAAYVKLAPILTNAVGQDLAANETATTDRRDASQEEIHHLIVNAGWQKLLPDVFSDKANSNSLLYAEWQKAEAGNHYSYGDPTCDSACKTVEFFYLATAAYLGSSADLESDEMRIKNQTELRTKLPGVVAIMENPDYAYPLTVWPDGTYAAEGNIIYTGL